jgi:hypothetical protein
MLGPAMPKLPYCALALLLAGCPAKTGGKPAALEPCREFGQTCEFSPGKLGSCVQKDGCTAGKDCFVCQSQH